MKKIKHIEYLPIILISFLLYKFVNGENLFTNIFAKIVSLCIPFFWALAIAYCVNGMMVFFEGKLKFKRNLALSVSYIIVVIIILSFFILLIPFVVNRIPDLINEVAKYGQNFNTWYHDKFLNLKSLKNASEVYNIDFGSMITKKMGEVLTTVSNNLQEYVMKFSTAIFSITAGLLQFLIGLVVSIYVLKDKENLFPSAKKLFYAYLGQKRTDKIIELIHDIDSIFGKYMIAKAFDSMIICVLTIIGFSILRIKFAVLFGIIIGITNMVPYFGPIIGAIPAVIITLLVNPFQALWVAIFVLVMQQVDGNIIGPKIIGQSIGLSPLWIVASVFVGGELFGFWGMLFGVPVFTLIRKRILVRQDKILESVNDCSQ